MFCFFKQRTAYEMRISDWSSDVCSSDLFAFAAALGTHLGALARILDPAALTAGLIVAGCGCGASGVASSLWPLPLSWPLPFVASACSTEAVSSAEEIGRASCRERVCRYV